MKIEVVRKDITEMAVDAIVNAANKSLLGGGGVDGAIHRAAGPELKEACRKLNGAETGEAKITEGFDLPARYVIHAVGPVYNDGSRGEAEQLGSCYRNSLKLGEEYDLKSIAFPAISTGIYGYPKDEAAEIAVDTIRAFESNAESVETVYLVAFDDVTFNSLDRANQKRG